MRYLVLSDIHANLVALEAVIADAAGRDHDAVIFLGDAVGYGNRAEDTIALLRSLRPVVSLLGNHDALLLDAQVPSDERNRTGSMVERVISRHRQEISAESIAWLRQLEPSFQAQEWQAIHGGLRQQWEYIDSLSVAQQSAPLLQREVCLFGHTHLPVVFAGLRTGDGDLWRTVPLRGSESRYRLPPGVMAFFNPGSVGQPRDGDPRASYGIFDTDRRCFELYRVAYDIQSVQASMQADGYPPLFRERLASGF